MNLIRAFLQSPTNRTALAVWLGTAITVALQYFVLNQTPPSEDLFGLVLGFVKIIEPETAVTAAQLKTAIADVTALIGTKNPAAIDTVVADAEAIAVGLTGGGNQA